MKHIYSSDAILDSAVSDKELEIFLHKELVKIESRVMEYSHQIHTPVQGETAHHYYQRVQKYLSDVSDIKKTDLVSYVSHRRAVIDLLENAIKNFDGKYVTEKIIHNLIMPMGKTSDDIPFEGNNLWLLDEKLVFHDYLASDKAIKAMPITDSNERKKPDILSLSVYDNPLLISEQQTPPLASIVVIEIKRPMRNDAQAGEDKDPIEQALDYLEKVRLGKVKTASGRPIPDSSDIPGYCYILCDLTDSIKKRCKVFALKVTSDKLGYFGYQESYKAYVEVISYDQLLDSAKKRNRAFFDKLGISAH